jgi:hypothetical protein
MQARTFGNRNGRLAWSLALVFGASCANAGKVDQSAGPDDASTADGGANAGDSAAASSSGGFAFDGSVLFPPDGGSGGQGPVAIMPTDPTVIVTITDGVVSAPSLQFTATNNGSAINVGWSVDQGGIAAITTAGVFTPTGAAGGAVKVIAGYGNVVISTTVTVVIHRTQDGFTGPVDLTTPGGYGGVGGEGPGGPPSAGDMAALQRPPTADPSRQFLYPYDKTVWPRGLLAPLLQWTGGATGQADATAIALHLESKTFVYDGYFARPAALASTAPFVRHPIPQDVWAQATESTAGTDPLAVGLVLLAGGAPVGPLTRTWIVAPGILQGTVYYESYGTVLVKNSDFTAQGGGYVGAAVLSIKPGDTGPKVAAGTNTPTATLGSGVGCRACHSVAAQGSSLIVQDDKFPYAQTSLYNLQTLGETQVNAPPPSSPPYPLSWAGLSPDGKYALTSGVWMGTDTDNKTELYQIGAGGTATPMTVSGLPAGAVGATPAFSPDGAHVAFTHVSGALGALSGDGTHVVTLDFDPTAPSGPAMTSPKNVFTIPAGQSDCVGFPSFLPTNDALLVQLTLMACGDNGAHRSNTSYGQYIGTSKGSGQPSLPSEIWWTDVATATQHRLDALDGYSASGTSYLPTGPNNHGADATLNFEPTVNPAASGGYAWVIFTSRRLYGNVATIDPFDSDPRYYDYAHAVTTKKLWVAAIDLNAPPGTDPSHPAFYLPAQELQAGNARGFWVLDPCKPDGAPCQAGDQCCGGYCQPPSGGGALVCGTNTPTCAQIGDRCLTKSDCCDTAALCINGFCALMTPATPK